MTLEAINPSSLVNGIYPLDYFTLSGVKQVAQPNAFWWSSAERYASIDEFGNHQSAANGGTATSETLEIDLGRIREVNYINFDILRAPIDIAIEFDALSTPDRTPIWKPTQQKGELPYEDATNFSPDNRNAWHNVEFNLTDQNGNMVHTRYLRLTFERRDEAWPTSSALPFPWAIFVQNLRVGRYVSELLDTVGPLLSQDTPSTLNEVMLPIFGQDSTHEARQRFIVPIAQVRVGKTPNLLGFGVLVKPSNITQTPDLSGVINTPQTGSGQAALDTEILLGWSLYDVTDPAKQPSLLVAGTMGPVEVTEEGWVDVYLDDHQIIPGDTSKVYEFRVSSLNQLSCNTVLTTTPNLLSTTPLDGTLTFTSGLATVATTKDLTSVLKSGDYFIRTDIPDQPLLVSAVASNQITLSTAYVGGSGSSSGSIIYPFYSWDGATYVQDASQNLAMRVWSDIADDGQDVLGNAYRHVVRTSPAENVIIGKDAAGWMSDPFPTPEAVEALYFDVRHTDPDTSRLTLTLIEALQIAPRTPGVKMNVYWTAENVHGDRPVLTEEWDNLYWTPVTQTYTLRRNEIITLPQPFAASFVKLEFSGLQPLPYNLPDYPRLPPVQFRTFPTWVNATFQSAKVQQTIQDWFLRNATPVQQQVLKSFSDPVREFQYQQQTFLAQLALGTLTDQQTINSGLVDLADKALVDPTTASKIYVSTSDQYGSSLTVSVDQSSVLGKVVAANYDLNRLTTPTENQNPRSSLGTTVPIVSTINDRISQSFQSLAQTPMRFYKPSRHIYTTEQAEFNKKAYFVGIDKIRFLRIDYTSLFDDALIQDILYDDVMLESNTWTREAGTAIPEDPIVYVSYEVGDTSIVDEPVELSGANAVQLATTGAPARNIFVFAGPNYTGVQYFQNYDYEIGYGRDSFGNLVTYMERSLYGLRMVVPLQPLIYNDAFTVIAQAIIPSEPFQDTAVVTATAVISGFDGQDFPTYGSGTYGGTATTGEYGDLRKETDDAATVVGTAVISGSDTFVP